MFEIEGSMLSLAQVHEIVDELASRIAAPSQLLPTFGSSNDFARPNIEVDDQYHWVVVERGVERERRTTSNLDELLYWIFQGVTFSLASKYELYNRNPNEDSRRALFAKQLDLLSTLDEYWARRRAAEILATLAEYPFSDSRQ